MGTDGRASRAGRLAGERASGGGSGEGIEGIEGIENGGGGGRSGSHTGLRMRLPGRDDGGCPLGTRPRLVSPAAVWFADAVAGGRPPRSVLRRRRGGGARIAAPGPRREAHPYSRPFSVRLRGQGHRGGA
ncbi:hypothetical protein GCM10017673_55660 [Streptosporangium violaceochromogenes]|nr:hypothetical protein GCM10017673_55660 [Streptosporangium violaceochromogenes]